MLMIAIVVLAAGTSSFWLPMLYLDEQSNVVYGDQVLAGRVPHRDFFATYGPANYWLIAGAFSLFGASVESQRGVGLLYHYAIGIAVYLCCVRRGRGVAIAAATTAVLLLIPIGSIAFAWLAAMSMVLFSVAVLQRASSPVRFGLAGAIGASCAWWRPEMIAVAGLTAIPFLLPGVRRGLSYCLGFGAVLIAMATYTLAVGPEWLTNVLNRIDVDAGYSSVHPYVILGALVVLALGATMLVCGIRRRERTCIAISILAAAGMPQLLQRPDAWHLLFVACAVLPLSVAHTMPPVGPSTAEGHRPHHSRLLRFKLDALLASTLTIAVVVGVTGVIERLQMNVVHVRVGSRSLIADAESAPQIRATIDALSSASAGSPVFIGALDMSTPTLTWAMLYHLLPASSVQAYYLEIPPGLDDEQATRLADDVRSAHALLLTEFSEESRKLLFPRIEPIADHANVVVRDHFCAGTQTSLGVVLPRC
jgi:hypothetical protein